jgi:integrase
LEGHFFKPNCKCPKDAKKCTCGATWSYIVDVGIDPQTGRRKQEKKGGFKTKTLAQIACGKIIQEVNQGIYVHESNITFEEFSKEWLTQYRNSGKVKESTVDIRDLEIRTMKPYMSLIKIKDITKTRYQNMLNDLKDKGYAERTISGVHVTGGMIFKDAIRRSLIKSNPTQFATIPKTIKTIEELEAEEESVKYLEKEELSIFLQMAKERGLGKDYPVFMLLAYTGIRVGELCALKWKDINFDECSVSITKTLYCPSGKAIDYKLFTPKTKASRREISVDEEVLKELRRHKARQNLVVMENRSTYHNKDFVFTKEFVNFGYPEVQKTMGRRMRRLLKMAKLNTNLTPHSLRHTHASLLAEAGATLPEIMERLGHKDDKTTRWVYLHTTKAIKKETSKKFSELMKSL